MVLRTFICADKLRTLGRHLPSMDLYVHNAVENVFDPGMGYEARIYNLLLNVYHHKSFDLISSRTAFHSCF